LKLHRAFNKRTGFPHNCNSERDDLAEILPVIVMATVPPLKVVNVYEYSFQATVEVGESTNQREMTTVVNNVSLCPQKEQNLQSRL
jgi:hypothetical protein